MAASRALPKDFNHYLLYMKKMGLQMFDCLSWAYRCLFVCLSVGTWRGNGNPNPCTYCAEILNAYPHLFKEVFGAGLIPPPHPLGLGVLKH